MNIQKVEQVPVYTVQFTEQQLFKLWSREDLNRPIGSIKVYEMREFAFLVKRLKETFGEQDTDYLQALNILQHMELQWRRMQ